jgi:nucleoside-diphosphate-sugar epimerase
MKRIFITGSSGCIGHYVAETLIKNTEHELYFLVRKPEKLKINPRSRPGIQILSGDLRQIAQFETLLATIDVAILIATAWGDPKETYEINVTQTLELVKFLATGHCQQMLYFSTESILDQNNQLLEEAGTLGTDYIRTKFTCLQQLEQRTIELQQSKPNPLQITALFPTLVFGGDGTKPYSHITAGLPDILRWLWLIRFFQADASFHFIHAHDIAQVVGYLVDHPVKSSDGAMGKLVLGNEAVTLNRAIAEICHYCHQRLYFQIPLYVWLAEFFIRVFRIQMADWDRFCLHYRHFVHRDPVNPASFGLVPHADTLPQLLQACGIPARKS